MLRALEIRDFVIVESASLEFAPGFCVLTGETGAGKSMLVDALELLVGGRGEGGMVRPGAERAELAAEFDAEGDALAAWLAERELAGDPGRLVLRRTLDAAGRSRAFINGHAATLVQLREVGEWLVDIHGQHAHQSLLRPAGQRSLVDAHGHAEGLARDTADAYRAWKRLEEVAAEAAKDRAAREAERAELQDLVSDLKRLAPREDEWPSLVAEHARLANGSSLVAGAQSAVEALAEADGACLAQLSAVSSQLRALAVHDAALAPMVELVESAHAQAAEAARDLRHYAERVDLDPQALRHAEARMEALHAAGRRHRVPPERLASRLAELEARLREVALAADAEALEREVAAARSRYDAAARKLSDKRRQAAAELSREVTAAMQGLAMAGGRFAVTLRPAPAPAAFGLEEVELEVSAHPSLPPRPLAKVASGGELSRVSLALQLVAARAAPVGTLVFDEVDAGVGGAVAESIGRALKKLGRTRQVLCITHLPQVAAQADRQWAVAKASSRGKVTVRVTPLDRAARIDEIARMLGGSASTARRHAAELLDGDPADAKA